MPVWSVASPANPRPGEGLRQDVVVATRAGLEVEAQGHVAIEFLERFEAELPLALRVDVEIAVLDRGPLVGGVGFSFEGFLPFLEGFPESETASGISWDRG